MSDDFTRHIFKHYIAKIAAQQKFTSVSEASLEILADVTIYRLRKYAREIRELIEHGGRTEPNGYDVFDVLWRYRESMTTLVNFIINFTTTTTVEIPVREYPIATPTKFSGGDQQDVVPFRAGAVIEALPLESPLPHIPRFLPSPFGEHGIAPDDDESGTSLVRRPADADAILSAMRMPVEREVPEIRLDCPLVDEIVRAVVGDDSGDR
jgi:hypothetical protein